MLIAILDAPGRVRPPDLLRNGLGEEAQLAFALLDFQIRTLQVGCALLDLGLKLIARSPNGDLRTLTRRTHDGDCNRTKNKSRQKALRPLRYRDRIQRRDKEVRNEE